MYLYIYIIDNYGIYVYIYIHMHIHTISYIPCLVSQQVIVTCTWYNTN